MFFAWYCNRLLITNLIIFSSSHKRASCGLETFAFNIELLLVTAFTTCSSSFLANVNSCSCLLYVVVRPSVVCLSSVTFVHPTQAIKIFGNVSTPFGTIAIYDPSVKILRRSSQGNPSVGGLNQRGVGKCSDFVPFQGYISEMVQDRR